jgi:hypothetical protein
MNWTPPAVLRAIADGVAEGFAYVFEWDPAKAAENLAKHRVAFETAATVFRDALALTVYDSEHSEAEERWATMGTADCDPHFHRNKRHRRHRAHHLRARGDPARA